MAAFDGNVRKNVLEVLVGMFNATPGARFLNEFAATIQAAPGTPTQAVLALAESLSNSSEFISQFPRFQTAEEFSAKLLGNLGLSGNNTAKEFAESRFNQGQSKASIIVTAVNALTGYTGTDAALLAAKNQLANKVAVSTEYSVTSGLSSTNLSDLQGALAPVTADVATRDSSIAAIKAVAANNAAAGVSLTTGADNIVGGFGNDNIFARIIDNANTLQSGDKINGSAGIDTLTADIGTSQNFAITPELASVEVFKVRGQADDAAGGANGNAASDNNLNGEVVAIDMERSLVGKTAGNFVQRVESNNSRADVVFEDLRLGAAADITKDVTIAFVDSDPGNVDLGVYFDDASLRAASGTTASTATIKLRDGLANAKNLPPLGDLTVDGLSFTLGGVSYTVRDIQTPGVIGPINAAQTYQAFATALQARIDVLKATNAGLNGVTVEVGAAFADVNGAPNSNGNFIVIKDAQGRTFDAAKTQAQFSAEPAQGSFTLLFDPTATPAAPVIDLITSTIVLDNVGRGQLGGDLVVGGLATGATTSTKPGVERFELIVEDDSRLQQVESTNDALREVIITNAQNSAGNSNGLLSVTGRATNPANVVVGNNGDTALPGSTTHGDTYGFNDVRVIDGSKMTGNLTFTAALSDNAVTKFMTVTDQAPAQPQDDNVVLNRRFEYFGGSGKDDIKLDIASGNFDKLGTTTREDLVLTVDGGAGDDKIRVDLLDGANSGRSTSSWYINSKLNANLNVNAGAGNDTVELPGAGDFKVDLGAGNDIIYSDNTGDKAKWVFNTLNQDKLGAVDDVSRSRRADDLLSDANDTHLIFASKLKVTFLGTNALDVTVDLPTVGVTTSDLQINQAIKAAINGNSVLKELLIAEDGPGNTLVVTSKIDGVMEASDLKVELVKPANAAALNAADVTAAIANRAYGLVTTGNAANDAAAVLAIINNAIDSFNNKTNASADYSSAFARNTLDLEIVGSNSLTTSDNEITGGAGDDLIVLGTTGDAAGSTNDSNEVLKFTGSFGRDTVVNFNVGAQNVGGDLLDFSSYFATGTAITVRNNAQGGAAAGTATIKTGDIVLIDFADLQSLAATPNGAENFNNLTQDKLLAALNLQGLAGQAAVNNVTNNGFSAAVPAAPAAIVAQTAMVMVRDGVNNLVKVFTVNSEVGKTTFTAATEVGAIDFADVNVGALAQANFDTKVTVDTPNLANLAGTPGNDVLTGTVNADTIQGFAGNDSISALQGNDTIIFNPLTDGLDSVNGGDGIDTVVVGGAPFAQEVRVTFVSANVGNGNATNGDAVAGGGDYLGFTVGAGDLAVLVQTENSGGSISSGNTGTAASRFDDEGVVFTANPQGVTTFDVRDFGTGTARGVFDVVALGTSGADSTGAFAGSAGRDYINGGAGDDNLAGLEGADFLVGVTGNDTLNGGSGVDTMIGGAGNDTFAFAAGANGAAPSATVFDTIVDYTSGTDTVNFTGGIVKFATATAAAAGTAGVTATTGVVTFNAADNTDALRLTAVASALGNAAAGNALVYSNGVDSFVYITDGTAGVGAMDVLIKLTGLTGVAVDELVVTGGAITALQ